MTRADAILCATPEYNGSIPGQLKNALDWASRPYPENALRGKPVAVVGVSTGILGAVWAQAELRKVLTATGARVLDREIVVPDAMSTFNEDLILVDAAVAATLGQIVTELVLDAEVLNAPESGDGQRTGHASSGSLRKPETGIEPVTSCSGNEP